MKDILTGNPALPGKPSGPCNMHHTHTDASEKNISDYVIRSKNKPIPDHVDTPSN